MKNLFRAASTAIDQLDFDNPVSYRTTFSRIAKTPKLSTLIVREIRNNWDGMELKVA